MSRQDPSFLNRAVRRRTVVAGALGVLATPFISRMAFAAPKVIRASTPGPDTEWQSKALQAFKAELDKSMPGAFDVQLHYNGTLFAQGSEIEDRKSVV